MLIHAKTPDELKCSVMSYFPELKVADYRILDDEDVLITDDALASVFGKDYDVYLTAESLSMPFSDLTSDATEGVARFELPVLQNAGALQESVNTLTVDFLKSLSCMSDSKPSPKQARDFIYPLLREAVHLVSREMRDRADSVVVSTPMTILHDEYVEGKRGHGNLDYAVDYQGLMVPVLEAPKHNKSASSAIAQLVAQMAAIDAVHFRRRRQQSKNASLATERTKNISFYGLSSSGDSWITVKWFFDREDNIWKQYKSKEMHLHLFKDQTERTALPAQISTLLNHICGVLLDHAKSVQKFEGI